MKMIRSYLMISAAILLLAGRCIVKEQGTNNAFWNEGVEVFEISQIFDDERLPNIVVTTEGTLLATWGRYNYRVRRSEDGGVSWGEEIHIASGEAWVHGGGVTVDEQTGDILVFIHEGDHTGSDQIIAYRSTDDGRTWQHQDITIYPDLYGNMPTGHMAEHGITLQHIQQRGRLLRPARYFGRGNVRDHWPEHYNTAMYSDDGGYTWHTSAPFPALGTGEGAIAELSDGRIYYNSRRHWAPEGENPRMRHIAWSYDGGETWEDLTVSKELPDGAQHVDYGLMGGLVRLPVEGHDILIFSNIDVPARQDEEQIPHNLRTTRRIRGTVWTSFDGGQTWPVKRLVDEGSFAYSSLAAGREGTDSEGIIYLLYESDGGAKLARFNLAWITEGKEWQEYLP